MNTAPTNNRETWLRQLADMMAPKFAELGKPIPPFRVGTGFTSGGQYSNHGGECWNKTCSADEHFEIFITPDQADPMEIAAILCHELIHAAVGLAEGHKGEFAKMMGKLGLKRPYTCSIPGPLFEAWVTPFLESIGELPHAALQYGRSKPQRERKPRGGSVTPVEDTDDEGDFEPGSSNQKKKQSTRMLKACCEECGYTIRLSKKWALSHGATCPECGQMEIEGLDED